MTPADRARRDRSAQGLPEALTDLGALVFIAGMMRASSPPKQKAAGLDPDGPRSASSTPPGITPGVSRAA